MLNEFIQELKDLMNRQIGNVHTACPGVIKKFNPDTGMATVRPLILTRTNAGDTLAYPDIANVPVMFPQSCGGQASVCFPIQPNDGCLIVFAERSLSYWRTGADSDEQLDYDLTNAIAIPGLFIAPSANQQLAQSENAVVVAYRNTKMAVRADGVTIDGNVSVRGNVTATGTISGH